MNTVSLRTITEKCPVDNTPHNFVPVPNQPPWVYCTKCLTTMQITLEPTPPDPVPPDPPIDATVITPTGGDDAGLIQGHLNNLASGKSLMLSGMFSVNNSVWIDGAEKSLIGDPAKQSGIRPMRSGMSGPYGHMLCTTPNAVRCKISALEFDAAGKPVGLVFFDGGVDNEISDCFLHDIALNPSGAPYGAIHTQHVNALSVLRNRIERTGGITGGEGIRGIYVCGSSCWIEGNTVRDTGHTGIAAEGAVVTIIRNTVERSMVNGTGCKICFRVNRSGRKASSYNLSELYGQATHQFIENTVRETGQGAGLMLQDMGANAVLIEGNHFQNCGPQGSTFGAVYSSNAADNVTVKNNRIEDCRSVGGLQNARNWSFADNNITGPNQLHLERECHNITLIHSGQVTIGQNCSEIYVDGVKVA